MPTANPSTDKPGNLRSGMAHSPTASVPTASAPTAGVPANPTGQMDPLAELRNIHLPDPVSLFPTAPGWWILAILVLVCIYLLVRWLVRHWRNNRYRRVGIKQLNRIFKQFEFDEDPKQYLAGFSELLKRLALTVYPRELVASLTGEEWVAFLDQSADSKAFSMGTGQVLMYSTYEREIDFDVLDLHRLGLNWIRRHRKRSCSR